MNCPPLDVSREIVCKEEYIHHFLEKLMKSKSENSFKINIQEYK